MNKRIFTSLVLGFGATLAVLVAVAMPPGSWAVVVGVLLGLLACIPLLIVLVVVVNSRSKSHAEPPAPVQPIILVQPPVMPGYNLPGGYDQYGYYQPEVAAYGYGQPLQAPQPRSRRGYDYEPERTVRQQLPARKRRNRQELEYNYYPEEYANYDYYPEEYAYDAEQARYEAYYNNPTDYSVWEVENQPTKARGRNGKRSNREIAIDAEFRTLGE